MEKRFRKKPIEVTATQWFKIGDHPYDGARGDMVVRGYRSKHAAHAECGVCGKDLRKHGWVNTLEGGHIVCPGDWIITGVKGERYPCKPDVFARTYEPVVTDTSRTIEIPLCPQCRLPQTTAPTERYHLIRTCVRFA